MIGLEYIIINNNFSQQYIADLVKRKKQNVNAWVRGRQPIPKKVLPILAEHFEVDPSFLYEEVDETRTYKFKRFTLVKSPHNYRLCDYNSWLDFELDIKRILIEEWHCYYDIIQTFATCISFGYAVVIPMNENYPNGVLMMTNLTRDEIRFIY